MEASAQTSPLALSSRVNITGESPYDEAKGSTAESAAAAADRSKRRKLNYGDELRQLEETRRQLEERRQQLEAARDGEEEKRQKYKELRRRHEQKKKQEREAREAQEKQRAEAEQQAEAKAAADAAARAARSTSFSSTRRPLSSWSRAITVRRSRSSRSC